MHAKRNMAQSDLRRVARAAAKVAQAHAELEAAILAAQVSGETVRDIAPFAELSPSRIHQILQEARRRQQPDVE